MKTGIILFCIVFASHFLYGQKNHIGMWKGIEKDKIAYFNLDKEGYAYFLINNDTLGGKEFIQKGIKAMMTYQVDYKARPHTIDLVISKLEDEKEVGRIVGIFNFPEKNKMKLMLNFEKVRPEDFSDESDSNTIILTRVARYP